LHSHIFRILREGFPPGSLTSYAFALLCFAIASLARLGINEIDTGIQSFATFYPAVLFATLLGGGRAGLLTIAAGAIVGWWAFTPPYFTVPTGNVADVVQVGLFIAASAMIVVGATAYRRILWRLREEEHFRQLTVDELSHRVKNKLTTIQAIVQRELRKHPDILSTINGRLNALAKTDEFIRNSNAGTASFKAILKMESLPYDSERFSFQGLDVELNAKLAITVALVFHELATNSSKHGALSSPSGQVSVTWEMLGDVVRGEWIEQGGPAVQTPQRRGFGLSLIESGFRPYQGETSLQFKPDGVQCSFCFSVRNVGETISVTTMPQARGQGWRPSAVPNTN
jgi:two-component sensor histidine kinase